MILARGPGNGLRRGWSGGGTSPAQAGVGLVETLIALAIATTALTAILAALSTGSMAVQKSDERTMAENLARSQFEYTKAADYLAAPASYATIAAPEGHSLTAEATSIAGRDADIQKVTVTVTYNGDTSVVEGFKSDRLTSGSPTPTPTPTPAPAPQYYYLHNNPTPPTGDTSSQATLPLHTTTPTATTLYNYDQDRDSFAGRMIQKGANGVGETDLAKHQVWRSQALSEDLQIVGTVTVDLYSAMKDFAKGKKGEITLFLRDYNGSSYTEIGNGNLRDNNWQHGSGTWVVKTITISGLNYTISVGHQFEIKLIVESDSGDDMWFAYDTTSHASVVNIP